MMSFRGTRLQETRLSLATVWLLESLAESKGLQQLFEKQSPQDSNLSGNHSAPSRPCPGRHLRREQGRLEMLGKGRDAKWRRKS